MDDSTLNGDAAARAFVKCPVDLLSRTDLSPTAKVVFLALKHLVWAGGGNQCTAPNHVIAKACGCSSPAMRRALDELEEYGAIRRIAKNKHERAGIEVISNPELLKYEQPAINISNPELLKYEQPAINISNPELLKYEQPAINISNPELLKYEQGGCASTSNPHLITEDISEEIKNTNQSINPSECMADIQAAHDRLIDGQDSFSHSTENGEPMTEGKALFDAVVARLFAESYRDEMDNAFPSLLLAARGDAERVALAVAQARQSKTIRTSLAKLVMKIVANENQVFDGKARQRLAEVKRSLKQDTEPCDGYDDAGFVIEATREWPTLGRDEFRSAMTTELDKCFRPEARIGLDATVSKTRERIERTGREHSLSVDVLAERLAWFDADAATWLKENR